MILDVDNVNVIKPETDGVDSLCYTFNGIYYLTVCAWSDNDAVDEL